MEANGLKHPLSKCPLSLLAVHTPSRSVPIHRLCIRLWKELSPVCDIQNWDCELEAWKKSRHEKFISSTPPRGHEELVEHTTCLKEGKGGGRCLAFLEHTCIWFLDEPRHYCDIASAEWNMDRSIQLVAIAGIWLLPGCTCIEECEGSRELCGC